MTDKNKPKRGKSINIYESKFYLNLITDIEASAKKARVNVSEWIRRALNDEVKRQNKV